MFVCMINRILVRKAIKYVQILEVELCNSTVETGSSNVALVSDLRMTLSGFLSRPRFFKVRGID
jgi:hypothetical protein